MMSELFVYKMQEFEAIKQSYSTTVDGQFTITQWPSKMKKRVCLIYLISEFFNMDITYSERDVNNILKPIYVDYVMLRRFLIDLNLLIRDDYGKVYQRTQRRIALSDEKNM